MAELSVGDKAPAFTLPMSAEGTVALSDYRGNSVILYFYPKDDTPGCTQEACDFRDNLKAFQKARAKIIGISRDDIKKHNKFSEKYGLNFPLLADTEGKVCEKYGVWVEKSLYGKKYMGIERATFLIDGKGAIRRIWRKVKVKNHAADVLNALKEIKKSAA